MSLLSRFVGFRTVRLFASSASMPLADVKDVDLDPKGIFKYILIKCTDKETKDEKLIVRGYYRSHFHADIFDETRGNTSDGFKLKCIGGGRIRHEPEKKELFVYGYSQGYGKADHTKTVEVLKKHYDGYDISYSDEGY